MFGRKGLRPAESRQIDHPAASAYEDLAAKIIAEAPHCHPLVAASKLIGYFSSPSHESEPGNITVEDIDHPVICESSFDGRLVEGLSFKFAGQRGERGIVYLFDEFGAMVPEGGQPRSRVSAAQFEQRVPNYRASLHAVIGKIRPAPDHDVEQANRLNGRLKQFLA